METFSNAETPSTQKVTDDDETNKISMKSSIEENKTRQLTPPPSSSSSNNAKTDCNSEELQTNHETNNSNNKSKKNDEVQVKTTTDNLVTNTTVTTTNTNSKESQKEKSLTFSSSDMNINKNSNKQQLLEKPDSVMVDSNSLSFSSSSSSTSSSSSVTISGADNNTVAAVITPPPPTTNTSSPTVKNTPDALTKQLTPMAENLSGGESTTTATTNGQNISLNSLNALQQQLAAAAAAAALQQQQQHNSINTEGFSQRAAAAAAAVLAAQMSKPNNLNGSNSAASSSSPLSQQQKPMIQGWNQQTPWQQQQQLMSPLNTNTAEAKAAAAVWTNALNAAANSNIQQQQLQLIKLSAKQNAQFPNPKVVNNGVSANKIVNTSSNTITQALNSMYSPSQLQKTSSNGTTNIKLPQGMNGNQQRSVLSNNQYEVSSSTTSTAENGEGGLIINPDYSLNSQIIDLIKQNPSQIEQILKLKNLYQMGGDEGSILEELQQLDQTVPANLAIVAAVANLQLNASNSTAATHVTNNGSSNRNSPRSSNYNQQQNSYNQNVYNNNNFKYNQNQNFHQNQYGHHSNHHQNSPQYHHNHHSHQQQQHHHHHQQQHHQNLMQLSLQQQQQLQQMQDYHEERFSRKVFVGGLPPDIDEDEIVTHFRRYGNLIVDWPHKAESKSYFPPKGYSFLIFQEERSVQDLIETCVMDDGKLYMVVSSPSMKDKPVQIRPWCLADSDFVMDGSQPLDPRKTIFVGGVPRPLKAIELAMIMDRFYGGVCYAGIDTDPELKYPKGAGRVAFSNQQSYIAAISARFVQLQHGEIDKRVEVKPYVLDDQLCDECQGARCGGKFAPFFCANVTCLQYYCEACWATIHTRPGREYHKPLVKEGADRPRPLPYK